MAQKNKPEANQVFRQFAWNLAGTLASVKAGQGQPAGGKGDKR
jgi:hypothetical protein